MGEGGVGAGELERVDRLRAEADRVEAVELAADPQPARRLGDVLRPDQLRQLRVDGVVRLDRGRLEVDRAEVGVVVVADDPVLVAEVDRLRRGVEARRRRDALAQRGREHERLERRAGLADTLDGEVELALAVVVAADHRPHRAVPRVDRDERRGRAVGLGQPLRDRLARLRLQGEVDRRLHLQAAAEHLGRAVLVDQLLLDVVDEVLRGPLDAAQADVVRVRQGRVVRLHELGERDLSLLEHRVEHGLAPEPGGARVRHRVVAARVGGDPGEERGLRDRQLLRAVAEVGEGSLLDAVGAVPEVDRVQVLLQDPLLRPVLRALELPGEGGLAHLPGDRLLVAFERVLDELLRDRRAPLDDLLLADVGDERPGDAADVDAVVLPEAAVLDRDDRVPHRVGDLVVVDERARLGAAEDGEDPLARRVVDVAVDLVVELPAGVELRDLAGDRPDHAEAERDRPEYEEDGEQRKEAKLADPAPGTRRLLPAKWPQGRQFSRAGPESAARVRRPRSRPARRCRSARASSARSPSPPASSCSFSGFAAASSRSVASCRTTKAGTSSSRARSSRQARSRSKRPSSTGPAAGEPIRGSSAPGTARRSRKPSSLSNASSAPASSSSWIQRLTSACVAAASTPKCADARAERGALIEPWSIAARPVRPSGQRRSSTAR